jgi:hypothetical protein
MVKYLVAVDGRHSVKISRVATNFESEASKYWFRRISVLGV